MLEDNWTVNDDDDDYDDHSNNNNSVAGELCKLARVTGPEFPHPFSPVGRCLPATGRCRAVRYKRQCLPGFCTMC